MGRITESEQQEFSATPLLLFYWLNGYCETAFFSLEFFCLLLHKKLANNYCHLWHTFKFLDASGARLAACDNGNWHSWAMPD
jgi:hypothetical protein